MAESNRSKTVQLDYPVQLADRVLTEITIRRMKVGDLIENPIAGAQDMKGELRLLSRLCGMVPEELEAIDIADYVKLQEILLSFRGG